MKSYSFSQIFSQENQEDYRELMLEIFGRNIKNLRNENNITQEQLAEMIGINHKYLGEVERGKKSVTALIVYKISKVLNVPICKILSNDDYQCMDEDLFKEIERLFLGKKKKDIEKSIKILQLIFD